MRPRKVASLPAERQTPATAWPEPPAGLGPGQGLAGEGRCTLAPAELSRVVQAAVVTILPEESWHLDLSVVWPQVCESYTPQTSLPSPAM